MLTEEEAIAAKEKLTLAVMEYYQTVVPELFMDDWVLVAHVQPIDFDDHDTTVNVLPRTGQPYYRTKGLLAEALGD